MVGCFNNIYWRNHFDKYQFKKNKIMKKHISKLPSIIFLLISLVFLYLLIVERNPSEIPSALLNKNIPNFETESLLKNEKFSSKNEFGKEIVIVNFFATWCKPCRDEHIYLNRFLNEKKIKIIGVNYKDNSLKTTKWLKNLGNPYSNIAIDKKGKIAIDWGVYGIPETFIVNSKGVIKYRYVGPINEKIYNEISLILNKIK
tara:strand:- start:1061 stop:1663 length:603 start_codon:yes stop_codon:yes gene_type:complete